MNLVEMVMAIAITGIIVTGTIVATSQALVIYQQADAGLQTRGAHQSAGVRAEQIASTLWRDADPPTNHGTLDSATASMLDVDNWQFRENQGELEQQYNAGPYATLTDSVQGFALSYLLDDGSWLSQTLNATQRGSVIALKLSWTESGSGQTFGGWSVAPDRQFAQGNLQLPISDTSGTYDRSNHEATISFSLGSWP